MCRWMSDSRPIFRESSPPAMPSGRRRSRARRPIRVAAPPLPRSACRRRAATSLVPSGVYTIPEIARVGLSQSEAAAKKIDLIVGRADFSEVARAHIAGEPVGIPVAPLRAQHRARARRSGDRRRRHRTRASGPGGHRRRGKRRFLHRADLQFSDDDRSVPHRGIRRVEAAVGAALNHHAKATIADQTDRGHRPSGILHRANLIIVGLLGVVGSQR